MSTGFLRLTYVLLRVYDLTSLSCLFVEQILKKRPTGHTITLGGSNLRGRLGGGYSSKNITKPTKQQFFLGHFIEKVLLYSLLLPLFPIFKSTVASQQKHFHRNCSKQDRNASLENNTTIANYVLKINHHLYFLSNGF